MNIKRNTETVSGFYKYFTNIIKFFQHDWNKQSKWNTFLLRAGWIFRSRDMQHFVWNVVHVYRMYEPAWLAKYTDQSYAFQLEIDKAVDSYLKKTNTKWRTLSWADPGITTKTVHIIKKHGWSKDTLDKRGRTEIEIWKHGLENAVYDVLDNKYRFSWMQSALHFPKYNRSPDWRWSFVQSFINDFYGDDCDFESTEDFKSTLSNYREAQEHHHAWINDRYGIGGDDE